MIAPTWNISQTKLLTRSELWTVLLDLKRRAARSLNTQLNLVIVRLACCCGLRVSEIGGLRLADVCLGVERPHIRIRAELGKRRRPRVVPLWWDAGTLDDLACWKVIRLRQGASDEELLVCSMLAKWRGQALSRHAIRARFRRACKALGKERVEHLTIHHGRHTFVSHALAGGRNLAEVRDAAGHSNVSTTSIYLHVRVDSGEEPGELFNLEAPVSQ